MNKSPNPSLKDPNVIFLSFFGVGFSPIAPGTMGTLSFLPFLLLLSYVKTPTSFFIFGILLLTAISCFLAQRAQQKYRVHDPGWIVIDECIGISVAWVFLPEVLVIDIVLLFLLFRFFDIKKIWPASYFDNLNNGVGTIIDDVVAGIFAGLSYLILSYSFQTFLLST